MRSVAKKLCDGVDGHTLGMQFRSEAQPVAPVPSAVPTSRVPRHPTHAAERSPVCANGLANKIVAKFSLQRESGNGSADTCGRLTADHSVSDVCGTA